MSSLQSPQRLLPCHLLGVPSDVLLQLAHQLLSDGETAALARASRPMLLTLQKYRIKGNVKLMSAIKFMDSNPQCRRFGVVESALIGVRTEAEVSSLPLVTAMRRLRQLATIKKIQIKDQVESLKGIDFCPFPPSVTEIVSADWAKHHWVGSGWLTALHSLPRLTAMQLPYEAEEEFTRIQWPPSINRFVCSGNFPTSFAGWNAPPSLTVLDLRRLHEQPNWSELQLPPSLRELSLPDCLQASFEQLILPPSLTKLRMGSVTAPLESLILPEQLSTLRIDRYARAIAAAVQFPPSLTHLELEDYRHSLNEWTPPASLITLSLDFWNHPLDKLLLPPQLQSLEFRQSIFRSSFNHPLLGHPLPASLTTLELASSFNKSLKGVEWPANLVTLKLGRVFNRPLAACSWTPPASLTQLNLSARWNQPVDQLLLPPSLLKLEFGVKFNQPVGQLRLPPSLQLLRFGYCFHHPLRDLQLPSSLLTLQIDNHDYDPALSGFFPPSSRPLPPSLTQLCIATDTYSGARSPSVSGVDWCALRLPPDCTRPVYHVPRREINFGMLEEKRREDDDENENDGAAEEEEDEDESEFSGEEDFDSDDDGDIDSDIDGNGNGAADAATDADADGDEAA